MGGDCIRREEITWRWCSGRITVGDGSVPRRTKMSLSYYLKLWSLPMQVAIAIICIDP